MIKLGRWKPYTYILIISFHDSIKEKPMFFLSNLTQTGTPNGTCVGREGWPDFAGVDAADLKCISKTFASVINITLLVLLDFCLQA